MLFYMQQKIWYKNISRSWFRISASATTGSIGPEAGIVGTSNEITYLYLVLPSQISAEIFLWLNQRPFRSCTQACASAGSRNVTCATPSGCLWEKKEVQVHKMCKSDIDCSNLLNDVSTDHLLEYLNTLTPASTC